MQLPAGAVTVVLGRGLVRRRVMALLDDGSGRGPDGRPVVVRRVRAEAGEPVAGRLAALAAARDADLVLVDRLTDGLDPRARRAVLDAVRRAAAAGPAVLVDDTDAVAALAVADRTLRVDPERGALLEVPGPTGAADGDAGEVYRAS